MNDPVKILYNIDNPDLGVLAYHTLVLGELWRLEDSFKQFKLYVEIGPKSYFYDKRKGANPWEYYFFQPTENDSDLSLYEKEKNHPFQHIRLGFRERTFDYEISVFQKLKDLNKYIKPKPHILNIVNDFYHKNMDSERVLGVQKRHARELHHHALRSQIPLDYYFKKIDEELSKGNYSKLLLATDVQNVVSIFKSRYGNFLIHYDDALLSKDGEEISLGVSKENPYKVGEDAIVETLLLSKVDHLLAISSNISKSAIIFGDNLKYTFIDKHICYKY